MDYRIEEWYFTDKFGFSYKSWFPAAPGALPSKVYLRGKIYGREPGFEDGADVRTSAIKDCKGETVHTESGSTYELGKAHKAYVLWMMRGAGR